MVRRGATTVSQVLIQWDRQPESLATWEDTDALRQHFPAAPAWGQAASQGEGIVSDPRKSPEQGPGPARKSTRLRQVPARYRD
jgi:hypothetical protein